MPRKFSSEITQLVDQYGLGTPVKRHTHLWMGILWAFFLGICLLVVIALPWSVFTSDTGFSLAVALVAVCLDLILLSLIVIMAIFIRDELSYQAYECTNGFIELNRRKGKLEVEQFLHWNDVSSTRVETGSRSISYYVTNIRGREMWVHSRAIWKRCKRVVAQRTATGIQIIPKKR